MMCVNSKMTLVVMKRFVPVLCHILFVNTYMYSQFAATYLLHH